MATVQTLTLQTERMQASVEDGIGWMLFNNPARHNAYPRNGGHRRHS